MCLKCGNLLIFSSLEDSRQEWREELFWCEDCQIEFILRTEYQTQSDLIESQTLREN